MTLQGLIRCPAKDSDATWVATWRLRQLQRGAS